MAGGSTGSCDPSDQQRLCFFPDSHRKEALHSPGNQIYHFGFLAFCKGRSRSEQRQSITLILTFEVRKKRRTMNTEPDDPGGR